jgi:hypothetical protein
MTWRLATLVSVGLLLAACGDVKVDGPDGGQEDALPQQDAGATLTLRVLVGPNTAAQTPGAGAIVALENPFGVIGEKTADADGRVTFTGVELEKGAVAATAYLEGYPLHSRVGITDAAAEVPLWIQVPLHYGKEPVLVSGHWGGAGAQAGLLVTTSFQGLWTSWRDDLSSTWTSNTWKYNVPRGEPFTLVSATFRPGTAEPRGTLWEQMAWIAIDHDAVTEATTLDLDFSQPASVTVVSGSFYPRLRDASPLMLAGNPGVTVGTWGNGFGGPYVGIASEVSLSGVGSALMANYTVQHLTLSGVAPTTAYRFCVPACEPSLQCSLPAACSTNYVDGYPAAGGLGALAFLDQPTLLTPAAPDTPAAMHSPVELHLWDANVSVFARVWRGAGMIWSVEVPETLRSFAIPQPPSTVDRAAVLGTGSLQAQLTISERDEQGRERRLAESLRFLLDPTQ